MLRGDAEWQAPLLWRSEFRSGLAGYRRRGDLHLDDAVPVMAQAEALMAGREHLVDSDAVLRALTATDCSAYDLEFITLARALGVPLITADKQLLGRFPGIARPL